ncbi:MAG: hypothetical protein ABFR95_04265 [Actinomycetota bacterium]
MNPFKDRLPRTIVLFILGIAGSFLIAWFLAPIWPGFCTDTTVGRPCGAVATQAMAGYLMIILGLLTMIFGPIGGSFLDLLINGHKWETSRGTESVITNIPILIGAIYLLLGLLIAATA